MKKIIIVVVVVIALVAIIFLFVARNKKTAQEPSTQQTQQMSPPPLPKSNEPIPLQVFDKEAVEIKNFTFSPSIAAVTKGGTVTWTNNDSVTHNLTSPGNFDSGDLAPGQTFSHTFDEAGTFDYHCTIHPSMTGKVIVQ